MPAKVRLRERGDTIVEVLIAIAVVGSVLGITYSIMNRNIVTMRDNQERTEATKQAQAQVESLKALWNDPIKKSTLESIASGFCITSDGRIVTLSGATPVPMASQETDFAGYVTGSGSCRFLNLYNVGIRRTGGTFTVSVRWDGLTNRANNKNEVVIFYGL